MAVLTRFDVTSPEKFDAYLRDNAPIQGASMLYETMTALNIGFASTYGTNGMVCAIGAANVVHYLLKHPEALATGLNNGPLVDAYTNEWLAAYHASLRETPQRPINAHEWLADRSLMSMGEIHALEAGFEGYPRPDVGDHDDATPQDSINHYFAIGEELRELTGDDEDYDEEYDEEYDEDDD